MSFTSAWRILRMTLTPNTKIRNWSRLKGYLAGSFTIVDVRESDIHIRAGSSMTNQRIPKEDFEAVHQLWADYRMRRAQRQDIRDVTRYSTYILSIYNWIEENSMSPLP